MTRRRLLLKPNAIDIADLTTEDVLWASTSDESSIRTSLVPSLRSLGAVPAPNQDFVALATLVFIADRTIQRPRGWERRIELEVPVFDPGAWTRVADDLAATLEILTSDRWTLDFVQREARPEEPPLARRPEVDRVVLFSGGADSLCGAVRALHGGERVLLVSHWDWAGHAAHQTQLVKLLRTRFGDQVFHQQFQLGKRSAQPNGLVFQDEPTRRSRSLLFVAVALAHAAVDPLAPLWVPENGFVALNPPLTGERLGALSTRTTHPLVLSRLTSSLSELGAHAVTDNPFGRNSKGQMYADLVAALGDDLSMELLRSSHSCSHVRYAQGTGFPPDTQCGICFGCLVRRAAFLAADLDDPSTYLHAVIPPDQLPPHISRAARAEVRSVRYAATRGVQPADVLAAGLPDDFELEDALDVAARGLAELGAVVDHAPDLARLR